MVLDGFSHPRTLCRGWGCAASAVNEWGFVMYAIGFTLGLFLIPCLLLGGFSWALERPGITDRGITSTVAGFAVLALGFVTLWAWVIPTPLEV